MKAIGINSLLASNLKVLLMLAFSAAATLGQIGSQGQLQGFVRDQSGAAVSSASVIVTDIGTGQGRTAQTDSEGYYVVANIPPALYEVSVEQSGFKRFVQTGVKLDAADRRTVDINLEVGTTYSAIKHVVVVEAGSVGRRRCHHRSDLRIQGQQGMHTNALRLLWINVRDTTGFNS